MAFGVCHDGVYHDGVATIQGTGSIVARSIGGEAAMRLFQYSGEQLLVYFHRDRHASITSLFSDVVALVAILGK